MSEDNRAAPPARDDIAGLVKELNETYVHNRFGNFIRHPALKKAAAALTAQAGEIEKLNTVLHRVQTELPERLAATTAATLDAAGFVVMPKEQIAAAEARIAELTKALEAIKPLERNSSKALYKGVWRTASEIARAALAKGGE
jgi:hypothetical protein